jgi:hypothetical protein
VLLLAVLTLNVKAAYAKEFNPSEVTLLGEIGHEGPGALERAGAIAVDESTNNIWVDDVNGQRVMEYKPSVNSAELVLMIGGQVNKTMVKQKEKQEANNEPVTVTEAEENLCTVESGDECGPGIPGSRPGQFDIPSGIAVYHNPATPVAPGEVYVGDGADNRIEKFDTNGHYITQIANNTGGNPAFYLAEYKPGLAADSTGNLLALDWEHVGDRFESGRALQFDADGLYTGLSYGPKLLGEGDLTYGTSVAVDERGDVYVGRNGNTVVKFSLSGQPEGEIAGTADREIVSVDPRTGDLFVASSTGNLHEVVMFSPTGTRLGSFESVNASLGMAYDVGEGKLYVSDEGAKRVSVFGLFPVPVASVPVVESETVSRVSQSGAVLKARIDPDVVDTSYVFQSATEAAALPPGREAVGGAQTARVDIGSGYAAVPVSASVAVEPGRVYYYRAVAHSSFGGGAGSTVYGPTLSFTSPALAPSVTTGNATNVTQDSVVLGGMVIPGSIGVASDTQWCVQYGTSTSYEQGFAPTSAGDAGEGTSAVPVNVELTGLWPDTLYHYRLVAVNSLGLGFGAPVCGTLGGIETAGADVTFVTSAPPAPSAVTGVASVATGATGEVAEISATLAGVVNGYGERTSYEFDVGSDTSYGSRIFGEAASESGPQDVTASVQGLLPGVTYHYRVVASSAYGTSYGAEEAFTTPNMPGGISPPLVEPLIWTPIPSFPNEKGSGPAGKKTTGGAGKHSKGKSRKTYKKRKRKPSKKAHKASGKIGTKLARRAGR